MIVSQPTWPWRRLPRSARALAVGTYCLVSLTGLLAGLGLRPLVLQSLRLDPATSVTAPQELVPTDNAATASVPPAALAPASFTLSLTILPQTVRAGGNVTVATLARLKQDGTTPTPGVQCALAVAKLTPPLTVLPQTTDANGAANWRVTIPPATPPGVYDITIQGTWGLFTYSYTVHLTVTG